MIQGRSPVKSDSDYSYRNKFNEKEVQFTPKPDEIMATFNPDAASDDAAAAVMEEAGVSISQGANFERGFAVFQVGAEQDAESTARALEERPEIANTIPVLIDDEGLTRYILPDEFTVQFADGVSEERAEEIIGERGSSILVKQRTPGYYTLAVPEGAALFETLREWSELDEVAFAEPSEAGFDDALYLPDDPEFGRLWALRNTGQAVNGSVGTADSDIDAAEAWDLTRGSATIVVAVIDTGADLDHPDLAPNILPRGSEDWDFADLADPVPADTGGHGTHVAGTAAAVDNSQGVIGVAPSCRLMPLRVNLTSGMNQNRADAINYVAAQATANPSRRYVVNCSWRMNGDHAGVHNAIINAVSHNVVVCFAAGNDNLNTDTTPRYPGIYPEVISVAATDQRDRKASFSNYGKNVDVSAPGVNIYSTYPDNGYLFLDGTSMASPHVAGLAALIWSRNPTLTNQQVRQKIETTCDNIDALNPGFVGLLGKGRINAFRALSQTPLPPIVFKQLRRFKFPQKNNGSSSGLAFARAVRIGAVLRPALLFLTQQPFSERIYFLNPVTGLVLTSIDPAANDTIGSMEWVGSSIRVANVTTGAGSINTINPTTGAQIGSIPAPAGRGEGLAYDGTYLYYSTITRIWVIKATTGVVVRSFPPPGGPCRGLTFGRGYLFSANSVTGVITVFNPNTLVVRGTIAAPGGGTAQAEGLAFNPATNELFIANQSENTIYVGHVAL